MKMKYLIVCFLIAASPFLYGQAAKNSQIIEVKNADFSKIINTLLDQGFMMSRVDSNYKTVRTEFKVCPLENGKPSLVHISFDARIKDGVTIISGRWYSEIFKFDDPTPIKNSRGAEKLAFNNMDSFARSLGEEVAYKR
jgi:hypothetical protein